LTSENENKMAFTNPSQPFSVENTFVAIGYSEDVTNWMAKASASPLQNRKDNILHVGFTISTGKWR
jgi:hypothetical protein